MAHHTSIALPAEQDARRPILTRSFGWGFAASFALRCNLYVLSVIMTAYCMERYGADIATASLATGIFTIGCLGARFLGGPVTDRLGLVPTTLLGFALTAGSSLLYLVAGDIYTVIAIRLCHGLFYGVASTTVTSMASAQVPEERHGEGMGYFMLSVTLASAVGPLVGIALMGSANYTALLLLAAGLAVAGFVATLLCDPTAGQEELGRELEDLASLEPDTPEVDFSPDGVRLLPTPPGLARFLELSVLPVGAVIFISYLVYGAVSAYLDPFAQQTHLMGAAGFFFLAYAASMLASRPFTAKILDRHGPVPLMVPGFVALGAGIGLMGLSTNGVELLVAAALIGYGLGAIQPTGLALATQHLERSRYTVANATFYMMSDLAVGVAPIVFGLIVPAVGYRGLFLGLVAVAAAGLGAFEALHRARRI
ncbi:MFS transporter [Caniella muris]|uniref:MFS transporter n=1 Tax=Caniella muris TaxID=2941502 RepID=UPI00203B5895|nr:MFS transporter [Caniella muris]